MIFKREDYMMYPLIANILNLTLNVSFVMSQGLSRYDKKGKNSKVVKYLNKENIIYVNNRLFDSSSSKIRKKLK